MRISTVTFVLSSFLFVKVIDAFIGVSTPIVLSRAQEDVVTVVQPTITKLFQQQRQQRQQQLQQQSTRLYSTSATTIKDVTNASEEKMVKTIDSVKTNLLSIRTGRASASILDRVRVEYYGTLTPLNQLASISVPSAQQLQIDPYDKSSINAIERSIVESDLGLSPSGSDGSVIRINIPPLTEQRRKEMLKLCKGIGEEGKVAIRNIRRDGVDAIKKLEKAGTVGEDEMKDGLDTMQKLTDKKIKDIDDIVTKKEKDVMTV